MLTKTTNDNSINADALGIAIFKGEKSSKGILKDLNKKTKGMILSILETEGFKGEVGETAYLRVADSKTNKIQRILLIGVGQEKDYKISDTAIFAGTATRFFGGKNIKTILLAPRLNTDAEAVAASVTQGAVTAQYELDKYKTIDKKDLTIEDLTIYIENSAEKSLNNGLKRGQIIGDSMNFTRDLCNEPAEYYCYRRSFR